VLVRQARAERHAPGPARGVTGGGPVLSCFPHAQPKSSLNLTATKACRQETPVANTSTGDSATLSSRRPNAAICHHVGVPHATS